MSLSSAVQKADKAASEVALGWVPLAFIFALCLPFFSWNTHLLGLDMFGFNI